MRNAGARAITGLTLVVLALLVLELTPATSEAARLERDPTCEVKAQRRGCNDHCGNGVVDTDHGEQCEPRNTATCDAACMTRVPLCDDGFVTSPEQCEPPDTITCDAACMSRDLNAVIGAITTDILRMGNAAGESALGDVIADAQLAATAPLGLGEAVVAFVNPGGIRDDLLFAEISGAELPGEVTYGEAFSTQPFGNHLVTMTLTGAQIEALLEQQFDNPSVGANRILQVSDGFTYEWDISEPTGNKVDPTTIKIGGVVVGPATSYRVTVNSFIAAGGDGFSVLPSGTDRLNGEFDLLALVSYFGANSPVPPGPQNRITSVP